MLSLLMRGKVWRARQEMVSCARLGRLLKMKQEMYTIGMRYQEMSHGPRQLCNLIPA
jgi:hypothetical protein